MSQLEFTDAELKAFRSEYAKGATDAQFDLFISECKARGLRPGVHLVFQLRNSKEWDPVVGAKVFVKKPYWITTIAALRLIAQRTGDYLGQGPEEYVYLDAEGNPAIKSEVPLPHSDPKMRPLPREPWVARATVYRKGFTQPMIGMARFEAYAGTTSEGNLTEMWAKRGPEQLFKCAEALAFRKAYPEEMAGLLLSEELKDETEAEKHTDTSPASASASVVPLPPSAPQVNHVPAQPTETPRPNEQEKVSVVYHADSVPATLPAHSGSVLAVKESAPEKSAIEAAKAAVPELKPASELPEPKKRGRKPKDVSPENGRNIPAEGGITDADIADAAAPRVEPDPAENKQEAEQFVADLDPTPNPEEMKGFTTRVRALTAKGMKSDEVKAHVLKVGGTDDTKKVTVAAWNKALSELENPKKEAEA